MAVPILIVGIPWAVNHLQLLLVVVVVIALSPFGTVICSLVPPSLGKSPARPQQQPHGPRPQAAWQSKETSQPFWPVQVSRALSCCASIKQQPGARVRYCRLPRLHRCYLRCATRPSVSILLLSCQQSMRCLTLHLLICRGACCESHLWWWRPMSWGHLMMLLRAATEAGTVTHTQLRPCRTWLPQWLRGLTGVVATLQGRDSALPSTGMLVLLPCNHCIGPCYRWPSCLEACPVIMAPLQ